MSDTLVPTSSETDATTGRKRLNRPKTSHLKLVPPTSALREQIRQQCQKLAAVIDKSNPLSKEKLEGHARQILTELNQPEGYGSLEGGSRSGA